MIKLPRNLLLVRHGESLHNVHPDAWSFHNDDILGLTLNGAIQAKGLGNLICREYGYYREHVVWSSPQVRAVQTASLIHQEIGLSLDSRLGPIIHTEKLREFFCNSSGVPAQDFDYQTFLAYPDRRYVIQRPHSAEISYTRNVFDLMRESIDFFYEVVDNDSVIRWSAESRCHIAVSHHFTIAAALAVSYLSRLTDISLDYVASSSYLNGVRWKTQHEAWLHLCRIIVQLPIKHCEAYDIHNDYDFLEPIREWAEDFPD